MYTPLKPTAFIPNYNNIHGGGVLIRTSEGGGVEREYSSLAIPAKHDKTPKANNFGCSSLRSPTEKVA